MESAPKEDRSAQVEKFATDFFSRVDFLFARRRIASVTGDDIVNRYSELRLNNTEVEFVQSAFTDNFVDAPTSVEIFLVGLNPNIYPDADSGGVQIITNTEDDESIYVTNYTVWFDGRGSENIQALKDTRRMPKFNAPDHQGELFSAEDLNETVFDDQPLDPSEQAALTAMIAKL